MTRATLPFFPWSKTQLSTDRLSSKSSLAVQQVVLDLYILGYPQHANKLLDALLEHSHGIIFDQQEWDTVVSLYLAWNTTDWMPSYIADADPSLIIDGRDTAHQGWKDKWARVGESWVGQLPEDLREKHSHGTIGKKDAEWAQKKVISSLDDMEKAVEVSLGVAVQIAMIAGEQKLARKMINEVVPVFYAHVQDGLEKADEDPGKLRMWLKGRLGLEYSPEFWKALKSDDSLLKIQGVDEDAVVAYVTEGCNLIKQRFTKGPERPYASKSISDLVHIMDENYIAARKANSEAGEHMSVLGSEPLPSTFLAPGATPKQIKALEKRISSNVDLPKKGLPEDYKTFLRVTNGFQVDENDQSGLFYGADEIEADSDIEFLYDMDFTLFPYDYTSVSDIDNISLGEFEGFSVGAGGDEGMVVLIPPSSVKPIIEQFNDVYSQASDKDKRMYERAAIDLYGGMEKLKALEWLVIVWYHWDPDQQIWGSFREHLEECTEYAVDRRKKDEEDAKKEVEKVKVKKKGEKRKRGKKSSVAVAPQVDAESDANLQDEEGGEARYNLRDTKSRRTKHDAT